MVVPGYCAPVTAATDVLDEWFVDVAGTPVRYLAGGSGEPIVLVHGLGGAASTWVELVPELVRRHRVLVLDLMEALRRSVEEATGKKPAAKKAAARPRKAAAGRK